MERNAFKLTAKDIPDAMPKELAPPGVDTPLEHSYGEEIQSLILNLEC